MAPVLQTVRTASSGVLRPMITISGRTQFFFFIYFLPGEKAIKFGWWLSRIKYKGLYIFGDFNFFFTEAAKIGWFDL
jgi:hypothetical protein